MTDDLKHARTFQVEKVRFLKVARVHFKAFFWLALSADIFLKCESMEFSFFSGTVLGQKLLLTVHVYHELINIDSRINH